MPKTRVRYSAPRTSAVEVRSAQSSQRTYALSRYQMRNKINVRTDRLPSCAVKKESIVLILYLP